MDGDQVYDTHLCLVCQSMVIGLLNYIHHKKNDCPGRKLSSGVKPVENLPSQQNFEQNVCSSSLSVSHDTFSQSISHDTFSQSVGHGTFSQSEIGVTIDPSLGSLVSDHFSPGSQNVVDPNMVISAQKTPDRPEDFFSSLELQIRPVQKEQRHSFGIETSKSEQILGQYGIEQSNVDQCPGGGNDNHQYKINTDLPISNILSSLDFGSDDDEINFPFSDVESFDSLSDESGNEYGPPSSHTGGKWKPGEGPFKSYRHPSGGKQPPSGGKLHSAYLREDHLSYQTAGKHLFHQSSAKEPFSHTGGKWLPSQSAGKCPPSESGAKTRSSVRLLGSCVEEKDLPVPHTGGKWKPGMSKGKVISSILQNQDITSGGATCIAEAPLYICRFCEETFKDEMSFLQHSDIHQRVETAVTVEGRSVTGPESTNCVRPITEQSETEQWSREPEPEQDGNIPDKTTAKKSECNETETASVTEFEETDFPQSGEDNVLDNSVSSGKQDTEGNTAVFPIMSLYICSICNKKYYNKYVMARHLLSRFHQNRAKGHPDALDLLQKYHRYVIRLSPFQCNLCQYYFNYEKDLIDHFRDEKHLRNAEDIIGTLKCTACKFTSHSHEDMVEHVQNLDHQQAVTVRHRLCIIKETHHNVDCKFCGKNFHSFTRLKRHISHRHADGKKCAPLYKSKVRQAPMCYECDLKCNSQSALLLHIRRHHSHEKPFTCSPCKKSFCDKYSLDRHVDSNRHIRKLQILDYRKKSTTTNDNNLDNQPSKRTYKATQVYYESNDASDCSEINETKKLRKWKKLKKKKNTDTKNVNIRLKLKITVPKTNLRKMKPPKMKIFKCNHCDYSASSYPALRPHYLAVHAGKMHFCDICSLSFLSEKSLRIHHSGKQHQNNLKKSGATFKCSTCKKQFSEEIWQRFHMEVTHNHPNGEEALLNLHKGKDITRIKYKEFFESIESVDRLEMVTCPVCKKFLKKQYVIEHLRLHSGDKPYKCRHCDKGFISHVSLRRHIIGHLGLTTRKCNLCGKEYKKTQSYQLHMAKHELETTDGKKHICEICGQSFVMDVQLKSHLKRHGERKFKCNFPSCRANFVFRSELTYHFRSHTGYKPFLCDVCGYEGASKTRLLRHLRTHTGERKYHCEYCTYKAGNNTHLRRHMRIHIGSKPYKCPYCPYTCNTHENIRKHIMKTKKHAGLFIYPCKFCVYGTNNAKEFKEHLIDTHNQIIQGENLEVLSTFSGLYEKSCDPRQPPEGTQILPLKERKTKSYGSFVKRKRRDYLAVKNDDMTLLNFVKKENSTKENEKSHLNDSNTKVSGSELVAESSENGMAESCDTSKNHYAIPQLNWDRPSAFGSRNNIFDRGFIHAQCVDSHVIEPMDIGRLHNYCALPSQFIASEKIVEQKDRGSDDSGDEASNDRMLVMDL